MTSPEVSPPHAEPLGALFGRLNGTRDGLFYGALITVSSLAAYGWALWARPGDAKTVAFMTLAFAQTFGTRSRFSPCM